MPLSLIDLVYKVIYSACLTNFEFFSSIKWVDHSLDYGMSYDDALWDENHHHSSFIDYSKDNINDIYSPNVLEIYENSVSIHNVNFEKNLSNI